jgi:hypothetical protein
MGIIPSAIALLIIAAAVAEASNPGLTTQGSTTATVSYLTFSSPTFGPPNACIPPGGEGGPVFLRVISSQGAVKNGTIEVTQDAGNCGSATYEMPLAPNATGFVELPDNPPIPDIGSYSISLMATYGANKIYSTNVSEIELEPLFAIVVTISIPSGGVTVVNSGCLNFSFCTETASVQSG